MTSAFSKSSVVIDRFHRIRVDGSRIRKEKIAFSNQNGYLWTGPYMRYYRSLRSTFLSCSPDFQLFTSLARFLLTIFEDLDCIKIHFAEGLFVFPQGATWLMVVLEKKNVLCNFKLFILSLLPINYPATVIVLCLNT